MAEAGLPHPAAQSTVAELSKAAIEPELLLKLIAKILLHL
jgi:hypothetical protein